MNEPIWDLFETIDNMCEAVNEYDLLTEIKEKMYVQRQLSGYKPFHEVELAYKNNKSYLLSLANEYIERYNKLPEITMPSPLKRD